MKENRQLNKVCRVSDEKELSLLEKAKIENDKLSQLKKKLMKENLDWNKVSDDVDNWDFELSNEGSLKRSEERKVEAERQQAIFDKIKETSCFIDEDLEDLETTCALSEETKKAITVLEKDIYFYETKLERYKEAKDDGMAWNTEKILRAKKYMLDSFNSGKLDQSHINEEKKFLDAVFKHSGLAGSTTKEIETKEQVKKECLKFIAQLMPHLV